MEAEWKCAERSEMGSGVTNGGQGEDARTRAVVQVDWTSYAYTICCPELER